MKLKCDEPLSNFAFDFNLRRYATARILVTSQSHFIDTTPNAVERGDGLPPNPETPSRVYTNVQVFRRKKSNAITLSALYLRWQNVYWENTTVGTCTGKTPSSTVSKSVLKAPMVPALEATI